MKGSNPLTKKIRDYKNLLRAVPSTVVMLLCVSIIITNLMAAKFIVQTPFVSVTGGLLLSWLPFLCMDVVTKRFGPAAAIRLNILGVIVNLFCVGLFEIVTRIQIDTLNAVPADYSAFNSVYGCVWQILLASSAASIISGAANSFINYGIGFFFKKNLSGKAAYMTQSYVSTFAGQFIDNFIFVGLLTFVFFRSPDGAKLMPVVGAAALGGLLELVTEIIFSPLGYRVLLKWEREEVGKDYLQKRAELYE